MGSVRPQRFWYLNTWMFSKMQEYWYLMLGKVVSKLFYIRVSYVYLKYVNNSQLKTWYLVLFISGFNLTGSLHPVYSNM